MSSLERDHVASPRPIRSEEVTLVDRVEEMKILKETVDRLVHGEGGLVFIHGEAGIGKTRLVRELSAYAQSRSVQVLSSRCPALFKMDGVPPYVLWKEVIKDFLEICTPEQLYRVVGFYPAEVVKLVPELSQKLRAIPQSFVISPEQEQNRLFEAVSQLITNISRESPLLVVLDDLQWCDPSSLLLLLYLAHYVQKTPLLLLGAYRSTDIDAKHPLTPVLTELKRELLPLSVLLKRMSLEHTSEIIRQILRQDEVPSEFCETVYEKTKGNPFFTEEVIESLKEEEIIYREDNQWNIKQISKIEFPETVKSVIKARISRLDDECQNTLTMASFIGNDFGFEELRITTNIEENKLLEVMEKMLKTKLIKERVIHGEDEYCFADAIVRDVLHEEVSHIRHKKLHSEVGSALEKIYAKKIDEHLGELAYHFMEGGERDKALDYFLRASEKSQKMYAYDEAFSYLGHALRLLEEKDESVEERARITERLGELKTWSGQFDAGLEYWNKALKLWAQTENRKSVSNLHVKMAHAFWIVAGDKKKASEHHQKALEILEKEPESTELANLYEDIGHRLWRSGEPDARSWLQKALDLAKKLGDFRVLAECYDDLGALTLGDLKKTKGYWEQGLKIAVESDSLEAALRLYCNLCELYRLTGEPQKALEIVQKGLELAKKVGDLNLLVWLDGNLAVSYSAIGEVQRALDMLENDLALAKRTKNASYIPSSLLGIGECYLRLGEWDKSQQYLTEALDMANKVQEFESSAMANLRLGELFMEMGDLGNAEKYIEESNNICEKGGERTGQFYEVYPALSRLYLREGAMEKAEELITRTLEFAVKSKNGVLIGRAEMLEAMIFRAQKNWEQSIQHFEKSLQEFKELDAQKWYTLDFGNLLYEYGSTFLERNEKGDKEKADNLLNQALEIFQKRGAKKDLEKVEAKLIHMEAGQVSPEPKSAERVAIGYADIDTLLYGGIPPKHAVVLTSSSCDETNLLIKSFLETGAKKGEAIFYVTIDPGATKPLAEVFQSNFYLIVCNPQADAIVEDSPNVIKLKGVENLTDISIALTSTIRRLDPSLKGSRRICISLISDVLLQHHAVQTRRWLTALMTELKSTGFTILAVIDPRMHPSEELYAILGLFDGEINIYERETEKGSEKFLKVKKMSNQEYLESELPLKKEELWK